MPLSNNLSQGLGSRDPSIVKGIFPNEGIFDLLGAQECTVQDPTP